MERVSTRPQPATIPEKEIKTGLATQPALTNAPGYPEAIGFTTFTINLRGIRYRRLVMTVVVICTASLVGAIITQSWAPLLGLFLLLPLCATFFHRDATLVGRWRNTLIQSWADGRIDLRAFRSAVENIPSLPTTTLCGMLQTIPKLEEELGASRASASTRQALALTIFLLDACASDRRAAATIARLGAVGLLTWAILDHSWWPLVGFLVLPSVFAFPFTAGRLRSRSWRRDLVALQSDGLDVRKFLHAAQGLDWRGIPSRDRDRLLTLLT
jgi:hypothetical protein